MDVTVFASKPRAPHSYRREALALILCASALYIGLSLVSFRADPMLPDLHGSDFGGPVGAAIASFFVRAVGGIAWLVPVELVLLSIPLITRRPSILSIARLSGDVVVLVTLAALCRLAFPSSHMFGAMPVSGSVGELFGEVMRSLFSTLGSYIVGITIVSLILIGRATFSFIDGALRVQRRCARYMASARKWMDDLRWAIRASKEYTSSPIATPVAEAPEVSLPQDDEPEVLARANDLFAESEESQGEEPETPARAIGLAASPRKTTREKKLRIIDMTENLIAIKPEKVTVVPAIGVGFRLPPIDLLEPPQGGRIVINEEQLKQTAQMLEKTLSDYGVSGKVEEIHPGPTVTTFEVSPEAGTKVSKVAGLADDLALGLSKKVRIIAPIPGKNRIGFEIPNEQRVPVNLRELIEDPRFVDMKVPLPCVLGRDIIGAPYFADLASMPHVIVAGATGAGKSVGLNVMLVSLLFRRTPEDLRLLMIDPKVVELAPFDRIPHMLLPVVTDMKQASNALKWAVDEMERRYQLFANAGTRNITTYNAWTLRVRRGEAKAPKPPETVLAIDADGTEVEVAAAKDGSDRSLPEKIPYIVIVVDEFADLMMQQGKDVETSVARLAQKARAAGMHVVLATQRPSVDVITGVIKANFPTRIAFRVSQKVDGRTILDELGPENLLGRGDMLIKMNGSNETRRVQCPFCSEEEVQAVTDFLRLQGEPVYDEAILKPRDDDGASSDGNDAEADPMYDAAVRIVGDTRRCSTSWIQRKLGIGYNRAAKIVETMERRGLVGPANGAKDREILISSI